MHLKFLRVKLKIELLFNIFKTRRQERGDKVNPITTLCISTVLDTRVLRMNNQEKNIQLTNKKHKQTFTTH